MRHERLPVFLADEELEDVLIVLGLDLVKKKGKHRIYFSGIVDADQDGTEGYMNVLVEEQPS